MRELAQRMRVLADELQAMYPARHVSRDAYLVNHADRLLLEQGLFSVVSARGNGYRRTVSSAVADGYHYIMLIARIQLESDATGEQLEEAELAMLDELRAFLSRHDLPEILTGAELVDWQQSAQQELPFGYVVCNVRYLGDY